MYRALSFDTLKGATSGYGLMASLAALLIQLTDTLGPASDAWMFSMWLKVIGRIQQCIELLLFCSTIEKRSSHC